MYLIIIKDGVNKSKCVAFCRKAIKDNRLLDLL